MTADLALPVPPKPAPVPAWRRPATYGQFALGGLFGGLGVMAVIGAMGRVSALEAVLVLAVLFPAAWLHLLLHEAGHALMGWAGGQHVAAIGLGPWRFERGAGGWRAHRAANVQGIGGFALVLPRTERLSRAARIAYLLGGPMANLLAAGAALALVAAFGLDGRAAALLHVFAVVGALIGAINLVPFVSGGWSSDGRQLLAVLRGGAEADVTEAMIRLSALSMLGVRPRDWPALDLPDDPALPPTLRDGLWRCRLARALDAGRAEAADAVGAARSLAGAFWAGPDGLRQITAGLLAAWSLKVGATPALVDAWIAESGGGLIDQTALRAWLRAALARQRGDEAEVRLRVAEARAALPRMIDPASRAMLADELDALAPPPPAGLVRM